MRHSGLRYADRSDQNVLDLYLPEGVKNPPLVVWIHGGAFQGGDKETPEGFPLGLRACLEAGLAVASINYRLSGEAIWPAQLQDVEDAFAYLRAHGAMYGYDAGRLASFGASAGGHLSAMAGIVLATDPGTRLLASVVWYPPIDFSTMDDDIESLGMCRGTGRNDAPDSPESALIGAPVRDAPGLVRAANPISYLARLPVGTQLPAFLIMHGAKDPNIGRGQSGRLFSALLARPDIRALEYALLPDGGHSSGEFERPETMARVVAFLKASFAAGARPPIAYSSGHLMKVTAITEVFADGQKLTAVALEYDDEIDRRTLTAASFTITGRTVTKAYANTEAAVTTQAQNGRFVILELSLADEAAALFIHLGRTSRVCDADVAVTQVEEIATIEGQRYGPDGRPVSSSQTINLVVDDFMRSEYRDAASGTLLKYNLFVPRDYDRNKSYPLVTFIHDAGATSSNPRSTLAQGLGAVIWASAAEQAKHECFVLAPQYPVQIVNDQSETTVYLDITVHLIKSLCSRYSIDTDRLYATGQSGGCMTFIAANLKYPDLFAASFLVAGQWDPALAAPLAKANLWIVVAEGDLKAFPGMNAITAVLEENGARVSRATWSGRASDAELAAGVDAMLAEGNHIMYTVLRKGTVVPAGLKEDGGNNHVWSWRIAYRIEGIRDWLFRQSKPSKAAGADSG